MGLLREMRETVTSEVQNACSIIAWLIVAFTLSVGISEAQDSAKLVYPAEALAKLSEQKTAGVADAAKDISLKWMFIENSFEKAGGRPSDAFEQGMDVNASLLKNAAEKPDDPETATIVDDVLRDLAIKTDHINSVGQISVAAYSEVTVEVRTTTSDGQEVNGYFIGFNPNHRARDKDPMFKFNNPTSPSSGSLPPGRYEMIAKLNDQIVQRQQVSIGMLGQGNAITCVVP